jgi:hypothetical protein
VRILVIALAVAGALFAADRLLLAAERRGWIYWRRKRASPCSAASAMLEIQSIVEPGRAHVADAVRAEETERDDEGDDVDSRKD